jgi:O-antigen/teichoic acid export membrane protein
MVCRERCDDARRHAGTIPLSVQINTLANVIGRVWVAALGALLIPVYVKLLGVESYALVGIHTTLQTMLLLLDLGLAAGLARELARLRAQEGTEEEQRDLVATFDLVGPLIGAFVALSVIALAPLIAYRWVNAQDLDRRVIVEAIRIMGVVTGLALPAGLYQGAIFGLERQVLGNALWAALHTIRGLGSVLVLVAVAPTVRVFFLWQLCISALSVAVMGLVLHRLVDRGQGRGRPRRALLVRVWRYSVGWAANAVGGNLIGLSDKVVLSRALTLKDFGYYTFASAAPQLLLNIVASVASAYFPRFNGLIARDDQAGLAAEYRRGHQMMATLLVPAAFVVVFFSREVLFVWTGDTALTASTAALVAILCAGMTMYGLAHMAYVVALCKGMFGMTMKTTGMVAVVSLPALILVAKWYGVVGAAVVFALMSASRIVFVPLLHRRHLRGEGRVWAWQALATPLIAAGLVCGTARLIAPRFTNAFTTLAYLGATWVLAAAAVIAVEPAMRTTARNAWRRLAINVGR